MPWAHMMSNKCSPSNTALQETVCILRRIQRLLKQNAVSGSLGASEMKDELLSECKGIGEFQPYHELSTDADALTVYFKPDADYSKRLTDHVTLVLSIDANEIVGCRIKGISGILEDLLCRIRDNAKASAG